MRAVDLIRKKRDGHALTTEEIQWLVESPEVPDYQWSALLMAIVWRGMTTDETAALTDAMLNSGVIVDLSEVNGRKVDKHSTGGVGDKTSLILAPIAAACGVPVPMVSGRGLGHTGGTLDKLEAIPGFSVHLDLTQYKKTLASCGLVLIGQTSEIAPADRRLYALRDATATVESIPLITASILSKKLAEGIDALVLDVKTGDGAFLPPLDEARALAASMCRIGRALGKEMVALITRMDQPLGLAVGNAIEVAESITCLKGEGPEDLTALSIELAAEMVVLGHQARTLDEARDRCRQVLADGSALERFRRVVEAQGGDPKVVDDPSKLPSCRARAHVLASRSGYVRRLSARAIGHSAMLLGAGRARLDSSIDHGVGIELHKKLGDHVEAGEPICTLHDRGDHTRRQKAQHRLADAIEVGDEPPVVPPLIVERH